jgi:diguanylate cyclase (GGDEF)-like protein
MRRIRYAVAGGLLGLGAPVGLLLIHLRRRRLSLRSVTQEIEAECETYVYSAASTTLVFALFGGVLGHYADRLAQLATTDPLTGLFNPRAFHERLRQELMRAARYQEPLSFLIMDVDGLKHVNDQYGHAAGDAALRSVATAIRSELREVDFGARLGGDEFGVVAPSTNEESAGVLAERLRTRVARGGKDLEGRGATVSIGIASLVPSRDERPESASLMAAADESLYQAKREGGDRVGGGRPDVRRRSHR